MSIVTQLIDGYYDAVEHSSDPRVRNWFMMPSIFPTLVTVFLYVIFVKKIGPKWMQFRKPYDLKNIMLVYNIFQVIISTYMFTNGVYFWFTKYKFFCEPVDYSMNPDALLILRIAYIYLLTKFVELLDTIFFVLRKKNNQVTNLHVIHHSTMPILCWLGVKFVPGGTFTFFGLLNTFVHIVMYGYYLLAALGPRVQKYLWWKKYLTMLQIVQFVAVMTHCIIQLFVPNCSLPTPVLYGIASNALLLLMLFLNFYRQTYIPQADKVKQANKTK